MVTGIQNGAALSPHRASFLASSTSTASGNPGNAQESAQESGGPPPSRGSVILSLGIPPGTQVIVDKAALTFYGATH